MGPLISPQAKERVNSLIQSGVDEGAKVLLDGRNVKVKGYENGNFVGPTIISNVTVRDALQRCFTTSSSSCHFKPLSPCVGMFSSTLG